MIKLINGDCFQKMKDIPDKSIDALVTDPPFGINFKYINKDVSTNENEYELFILNFMDIVLPKLKDGAFIAIWQAAIYFKNYWKWFGNDIHIYAGCKNFVQLRKCPINYAFDPIVMKYTNYDKPLKPLKPKRNIDFFVANTAKFVTEKNSLARQHPCPRPIDQCFALIENFVIEEGIVLDPFMGSGSIGIACKNFNRKYIGIEKEESYFNLGKTRIETHIIKTA